MRKKLFLLGVLLTFALPLFAIEHTIIIGKTMYQNQSFTVKDKEIFDSDWEGLRVWRWSKAQEYCKKLKVDGYGGWRVASQKELQSIMRKKPSSNGLYIRSDFAMPQTGGKYDNVWMWTCDSKKPHLGAYVNFKKAKSGWADKKYKGYVLCTREVTYLPKYEKNAKKVSCKGEMRQELTHSSSWLKAWHTCSGYTALKRDGTLWQFGKVGGCDWGQIIPVDPETGEPIWKEKSIYHLKPKKIGVGFKGAKMINGSYRMYAIKKDGTLWGWGEGLGEKPRKLSSMKGWLDFGIKDPGNGCCGYDVGLKKDGTLWCFPESAFSLGKYKRPLKLKKIGQFSDWKKIVLGCCNIYGVRGDGSLWRSSFDDEGQNAKMVFKRYKAKKKTYGGDVELYPYLRLKMAKVPSGTIYDGTSSCRVEASRDGTLCLSPEKKYD